ncbi:MAG: hypothetical protein M3337_07430 [Actinomycetota bacterium]|nr:hypothetical protein [Actinomycetota bacterium]
MSDATEPGATPRVLTAVLVVVNLPIVVATVRALVRGWQPLGDNDILLVRVRDVFTEHHPLIGMASSASVVVGEHVNHPGPLFFDLLTLPVMVLGPWVGLAVGVMLTNMASSSLAVIAANRIGGRDAAIAVGLVTAGLQFAMGSELLFDAWQPNAMLLPSMAFLVCVWGLAVAGRLMMAPSVFGLGSLLVQTHLGHVPLVGALTLGALGAVVWRLARGGRDGWRRAAAWTLVVTFVCWLQPLIEQFAVEDGANLSAMARSATASDAPTIGFSLSVRLVAEALVVQPWFTRSSYATAVPEYANPADPGLPVTSLVPALVIIIVLVAALIACAIVTWRRGRRPAATMSGVAVAAVVTVVVAVTVSPINAIGLAPHQMRWAWAVGAFATASIVTTVAPTLRARLGDHLVHAGVALAAVVAVANLPTHPGSSGPMMFDSQLPKARNLVNQLDALVGRGPVLYDPIGQRFMEPFSGLTFAQLQDLGIPFVFDHDGFVQQFGESRRNTGHAVLRMWQAEGSSALVIPPGAERVAFVDDAGGPVAIFVEPID